MGIYDACRVLERYGDIGSFGDNLCFHIVPSGLLFGNEENVPPRRDHNCLSVNLLLG